MDKRSARIVLLRTIGKPPAGTFWTPVRSLRPMRKINMCEYSERFMKSGHNLSHTVIIRAISLPETEIFKDNSIFILKARH